MVMEEEQTRMELASESVPVPQVVISSNEPGDNEMVEPQKKPRIRKKVLHIAIRKQMEFYFGDANLSKDRFLGSLIKEDPYVNLEIFLRFNKIRALTTDIRQIVKALRKSDILSVSEDGLKVCRVTPISQKDNIEECTIYVQRLPLNADHEWLCNVFGQYGPVSYVSIPRYKSNKRMKGFAFVEYEEASSAAKCLEEFREKNCVLPSQTSPETLLSITTFHEEEMMEKMEKSRTEEGIEKTDSGENCDKNKAESEETMAMMETESSEIAEVKSGKKKRKNEEPDSETDSGPKSDSKRSKKFKEKNDKEENNESQNAGVRKSVEKESNMDEKILENDSESVDEKKDDENSEDKFYEKEKEKKTCESTKEAETGDKDKKMNKKKDKKCKSASDDDRMEVSESVEDDKKEIKTSETLGDEKAAEIDDEVFVEGDRKKKRKRKRQIRVEKVDTAEIGMQIMAKKDWKTLRNKYLELQRSKMKSLKAHLKRTKWNHWNNYEKYKESEKIKTVKAEESKENNAEGENKDNKSTQRFVFTPGVIVKIEMDEPCSDPKNFKAEFRGNSNIKYVDIAESASEAFIRCDTSEAANALAAQSNEDRSMSILQGEEETEYWNKMSKDREDKLGKKIRVKQRGRDKLLKKAEKELGKHIKFDEV